ncbi:PD-(D/E)XK nuclease family protein [candidate division WOR-3 bacterium]|nr:PD-(D/E)XK nuclease family protein [candidate division WOR-3 bacterium]
MKSVKIFKLTIDNQEKEFFLIKNLIENNYSSDHFSLDNGKKARKIIYVANSGDKIRRLIEYLRNKNLMKIKPWLVSIRPLFDLLYDMLPPEERTAKRLISDEYAKIIIRHLLLNRRKYLFRTGDFSLSTETANFFLEWIKNIKEYNLSLKYKDSIISYREDSSCFDLLNRENRFNEKLLSILCKVFTLYEEFLSNNEIIDESDKRWWVIDHLKPHILKEYSFYIEHLSILRRIEQNLFMKIYKEAKSVSLLDFFYSFPGARFTTTGIIDVEKEEIEIKTKESDFVPEIKLLKYEKKEHEVDAIARKVKDENPDKNIIIISTEIENYTRTFERIFPRYSIHPSSLFRKELIQFPVIKTCLAIFEIIHQNFKRRAVVSFLMSPYIKILKDNERMIIDKVTREEMIVSGDDWKRIIDREGKFRVVSNFIKELNILKSKKGTAFIEQYVSILNNLIQLDEDIEIIAYNSLLRFILSIKRKPLVNTIQEFGIMDFQRIIFSYSESMKISLEQKIDTRVEMLDLEEIAGMNFNRVFLTGLVEGKLPRKPQHNPLFSEKLLEEMGFPTYDMLYTLSKFNFESIIKGAKKVYCSYYEKDEKGNVFIKSPFLQEIQEEEDMGIKDKVYTLLEWQMSIGEIIHTDKSFNENLFLEDMRNRVSIIKDAVKRLRDENRLQNIKEILFSSEELRKYVEIRINELSNRISAISLETYKRCPYSFFFRYILNLGELEEPEEGVDNLIKGKIIHHILARFYERRLSKKIKTNHINNWEELRKIALETIEKMAPGVRDRILMRLELISKYYKSLFQKFLETEVMENINHTVLDVEWKFYQNDVWIMCNGERLSFVGRIDRIDRNSDGLIIYDYKTGSKSNLPSNRKIENGESFQFPIYNLAVQKCIGKVAKTAYYVINSKEGCIIEERNQIPIEMFISNIERVWKEIKELNFEPLFKQGCETFCIYSEFCPKTI